MSAASVASTPSGAQRVTLAAAVAWIGLHAARALVFPEENQEPLLLGACLALALAAMAWHWRRSCSVANPG